ncbi:hypothetical protein ACWD5R_15885 [Streptomyces sp. NPDC002514]|uniref:hypothetical protein n=1 Tax=unclassified Streptomyces TaxID=2593676 RepID=UPI0036BB9435
MLRLGSRGKRIAFGTAAALGAALFTVTSATSAQAASYGGSWNTDDVKIRKGPSTDLAIVDRGYKGDAAGVKCWVNGEGVYGNTTWWYVKNLNSSANVWGYTSDYYFNVTGGKPPKC